MIEEIRIKNLGVIDEAVLPLSPGFTALTGETGAGKTMVVTALGLLLGERSDSGVVRAGTEQTTVDGLWLLQAKQRAIQLATELGADIDILESGEAELMMTRTVSQEGRSRALIGGRMVPATSMRELSEHLVTVHGQSEQLRLRSATQQRNTLDMFAGPKHLQLLEEYQESFTRWQELTATLETLRSQVASRQAEAESLRVALNDFERLEPRLGEDIELQQKIDRLENIEELRSAIAESYRYLRSEDQGELDVLTNLHSARRALERARSLDDTLESQFNTLTELELSLTELASDIAHYMSQNELENIGELEDLHSRKADLTRLARSYGGSLEEAINHAQGASDRLLELDQTDESIDRLEHDLTEVLRLLKTQATQLSDQRADAAKILAARVTEELVALAMPNAKLVIRVDQLQDFSSTGKDKVEFLLEPHPGAEPRPLAKGASGGELSRVMLALEVVLAVVDPVPTFIFDEIDAGVGGTAALEIGRRLARLAEHAQVIVVTHLAQVAAFAHHHIHIEKNSADGATVSALRVLEGQDRVSEMARLLSGHPDSANALAHAKELLDGAKIG